MTHTVSSNTLSNTVDGSRRRGLPLTVAVSAIILLGALAGSANAANRGGGGGHASHGGGGHGGRGGGGGYRGGGWGGGYYPGPAIVYGDPYYCAPPLVWTLFGAGGECY
jgi:hypothetical protein